ncbi:MAG: hypothetical protein WDA16_10170 [Candidatus Thermoplasmatota archaeon]
MVRHLALGMLALALLPLAVADLPIGGGAPYGLPGAPQAYCTVLQTTAHTPSQAARCDVRAFLTGVQLIRVRLVGEGHALAYADQSMGAFVYQWGPVQCSADATHGNLAPGACSASSLVNLAGATAQFHMILLVDGPGHASATATLEDVLVNLP